MCLAFSLVLASVPAVCALRVVVRVRWDSQPVRVCRGSIERDGDRQLTEEWSSRLNDIATHSCGEELERTAAPQMQRAKFNVEVYVTLRAHYVGVCVE